MNAKFLLVPLMTLSAFAADSGYNGRWNIHVKTPRNRVWWLEVQGAGSGSITGSFVGAPGGQVDPLRGARLENGELVFTFQQHASSTKPNTPIVKQVFRAKLVGDELQGTREETIDGKPSPQLPWRGVRAPVITDKDDNSWRKGRTVQLFNGKSTSGWAILIQGQPGWYVEDGILKNKTGASDLVSTPRFWNFEGRLQYRYSKGSNSGVALRGRYEIQIFDNFGQAPDQHGNGALYSRIAPAVNASKAPGEWQEMVVRLVGRTLTVTLNGAKVIDHREVVGPTAMNMDPNEDKPGPLVLQGDHGPVEFRLIEVTELLRN
jgi:hypothetical protein